MSKFTEAGKINPTPEKNEKEFEPGQKVIVKRTSGEFETGWEVIDKGIGVVRVAKIFGERQISKIVPTKTLLEWNDETKFLTGQSILLKGKNSLPWPGWQVIATDPVSGLVKIFNKTINETCEVPPDQLIKDFSATERYKKIKEIKK